MPKYEFPAKFHKEQLVMWIREWFEKNGPGCNAVLGISGGKDSSIAAALCVEALGADRVIGVLMPNGVQHDICDSVKLCEALNIRNITIDIKPAVDAVLNSMDAIYDPQWDGYVSMDVTEQTRQNLPPRIRMSTLYAVSQSMNGRVVNTCNLSETMIGWETRWGDAVGDFAPFADLTATEVIEIGKLCNIPIELVVKKPADGLCGKTDEDAFGFTYYQLDKYLRTGETTATAMAKIQKKEKGSTFKRREIPKYHSGITNFGKW